MTRYDVIQHATVTCIQISRDIELNLVHRAEKQKSKKIKPKKDMLSRTGDSEKFVDGFTDINPLLLALLQDWHNTEHELFM